MKQFLFILATVSAFFMTSCNDDKEETAKLPGEFEIEFDNIALVNNVEQQLKLREVGSTEFDYTNGLNQPFNITLLKYFISEIVLEGPNGEYFADPMSADAAGAKGYYLVDEAKVASQLITLSDVPAGNYNKLSFTIGVEEDGIKEGAAGGALDPVVNQMFWSWNAGYVALKFEGQSPVSPGGAGGNTIKTDNKTGVVFHVGGWRTVEGTAFVNNNKRVTLTFDENAVVESKQDPHAHLTVDVLKFFNDKNQINFTGNINIHKPSDGTPMAENMVSAFQFDHLHQ